MGYFLLAEALASAHEWSSGVEKIEACLRL